MDFMTKKEIDTAISNYYKVLFDFATREVQKYSRSYEAGDILSCLYLHLLKKKGIKISFYSYSKAFIRNEIRLSGSELNRTIKRNESEQVSEVEQIEVVSTQDRLDSLKGKLKAVKCKDKVNQFFLDELIHETDHTKETIGAFFGIKRQAVTAMISHVAKEVSNQVKK